MDPKDYYTLITDEIRKPLTQHNITADAEAGTLSIYYKLPPDGLFQNTLRIANHAPTAKQMFGNKKTFFPSKDPEGNITLYIFIGSVASKNPLYNTSIMDYDDPERRTITINRKKFDRLNDSYPKDADGNLLFPYKMYLFDSMKFFENDNLIYTDVLNSIGMSCYKWYTERGQKKFIVPDNANFAFMREIICTGVLTRPIVNEFKENSTNELIFRIANIIIENSDEKLDVLLHAKNLPGFLLREFIREYSLPVSNNFKRRKTVEVDTESMKASELLKKYFIEAGFPEEDIAVRQESNGLILDIKDNTTKILFATIMAARENISYVEVCKKYRI